MKCELCNGRIVGVDGTVWKGNKIVLVCAECKERDTSQEAERVRKLKMKAKHKPRKHKPGKYKKPKPD